MLGAKHAACTAQPVEKCSPPKAIPIHCFTNCSADNEFDALVVGNSVLQKAEEYPPLKIDCSSALEADRFDPAQVCPAIEVDDARSVWRGRALYPVRLWCYWLQAFAA